ncbi:MAG: sugar ABC transporter ATP-binding protein [Acidimicrobiales bacterium]
MIGTRGLSVQFGPVRALDHVDLDIVPGEVHALVGENGSGKSTLLKVLGGVLHPTEGTVVVDGFPVTLASVHRALALGIGIVFQELSLFPHLSGYTNIMIGQEKTRFGFIDRRQVRREAQALLARLDLPEFDLGQPISTLSVAEQQMVEVLKCLSRSPRTILFDEPTASLTRREAGPLLATLRHLGEAGYSVVFVSHYLEEAFEVADRITVLRDGRIALQGLTREVTQESLVRAMLGRAVKEFYPRRARLPTNQVRLSLQAAACSGVEPIDIEVRAGEILGLAGSIGSGAAYLAKMLGGLRPPTAGTITVDGRATRLRYPADALAAGIGYVPEDRRSDALLQTLSIAANITLPLVGAPQSPLVGPAGFMRRREERLAIDAAVDHVRLKVSDLALPISSLSGGNQQKIVLSRWFIRDVPCLVLNNPTKGIDVGSKEEVYAYINGLADSGHTIIFVSSYNPELLGLADRIVAFFEARVVGVFDRDTVTEEQLIDLTMVGASDARSCGHERYAGAKGEL